MFCPKCGVKNPDDGKFCRSCGADLSNVLAVVDGNLIVPQEDSATDNYARLSSTGFRNTILGAGLLVISVFLFTLPGDTIFWLFAMIPAFCLLASGVSRIMAAEAIKANRVKIKKTAGKHELSEAETNLKLPPTTEDYIKPNSSPYRTDELTPQFSSVVEDTTRHLEMDSEGKTMTLPKK